MSNLIKTIFISLTLLFLVGCASHQRTAEQMQKNRLNSVLALADSTVKAREVPISDLEVIVPGGTIIPDGKDLIVRHKTREPVMPFFQAALAQTDYPIPPSQFVQVLDKLVGPALTLGTAWLSFDFAKDIATSSLSVASTAAAREPLIVEPTVIPINNAE